MKEERVPAPAIDALRCGECERKMVVHYPKGMECTIRASRKGPDDLREVMAVTLRSVASAIGHGVHEHGGRLIPRCENCEETDEI